MQCSSLILQPTYFYQLELVGMFPRVVALLAEVILLAYQTSKSAASNRVLFAFIALDTLVYVHCRSGLEH